MSKPMSKPARKFLLLSAVLALSLPAFAVQDQAIPEDSLGLSKTSVYDDPAPIIVNYGGGDPGTNKRAAKSYNTAPPMITHTITDMLPITRDNNTCKACHVDASPLGQKLVKGMAIPAPASHYVDVKKGEMYMGRWNCIQCHRPQAKVDVLVQSTFKKVK